MKILTIDDFLKEQDHVDWLVDKLLPAVGWTLLVGERGNGKTTFATQLCLALEKGDKFLGMKVKKTRTMIVQADSEEDEFREMLRRIAPKGGKNLVAVSVPDKFLRLPKSVLWIKEKVERYKPGFVVFDSLYTIAAQDINTAKVMMDIAALKDLVGGIPWMLIHHPPHEGSRGAGHHSLEGNCSNAWILLKSKLKINKGRLVGSEGLVLSRDENGLWIGEEDSSTEKYEFTYDDIVRRR